MKPRRVEIEIIEDVPYMMKIQGQSDDVHTAVLIYGNTLRLGILHELQAGPANRTSISNNLGVTEQNLSRQLKMLIDEGLVAARMLPGRGRPMEYTLNPEQAARLRKIFLDYLDGVA